MAVAWTSDQVPGSLSVTRSAADSASKQSSAAGRCPRCERPRSEGCCPGVKGEVHPLGS
jgi:hypothetical protein